MTASVSLQINFVPASAFYHKPGVLEPELLVLSIEGEIAAVANTPVVKYLDHVVPTTVVII